MAKLWRRRNKQLSAETIKPRTDSPLGSLTNSHKQEWQEDAWDSYRDNVGEFAAVVDWRADAISKARLYVGRTSAASTADPAPVEDADLLHLLDVLGSGGSLGHSQMLHRMSIHLDVPGETMLVGTETTEGQAWFAASPDQVTTVNGSVGVQVNDLGDTDTDYIACSDENGHGTTTVISRIWNPDPREPWKAFSPARYSRKPLRILNRLTDRVNANTLSRLNNQLMLISGDVTLPTARPDMANLHSDPQLAGLIYGATQAIQNPESPSAVIPIIARAMGDITNKIEMIDFGTSFDEQLVPLFDLFIRRLALMLNVPPEILLGLAQANHWTGWLVSDDAVRIHLSPTLELICDALTRVYLRPAIRALNRNRMARSQAAYDPRDYVIWYDASRITERPNRAEDARADYAAGVIGERALRRATGYNDDDQPTERERRDRILLELALAGRTVEEAGPWLEAMGISLDAPTSAGTAAPAQDAGTPGPPLPAVVPRGATGAPAARTGGQLPATGPGVR